MANFVDDVFNVYGVLAAQANDTQNYWQDSVAKRFYDEYMKEYEEKTNLYANGGSGMTGKGLSELLVFFDEKEREMANLM